MIPQVEMKMLSTQDIEKIAKLAHLCVEKSQIDKTVEDFNRILGLIEQLGSVDTSKIDSSHQVTSSITKTPMEKDQKEDCLDVQWVLRNSPKSFENYFQVPQIISQDE